VITGDMNTPSSKHRLEGYRQALAEQGIPFQSTLIYQGSYTLEAGEKCTKELLTAKHRPTAIFCMCDEIALGCYSILESKGFNVPDDISIVGFDDIRFANYFSPALTTIAQPVEEIGRCCVEALIKTINGQPLETSEIILPHKLVVRDSTRAI